MLKLRLLFPRQIRQTLKFQLPIARAPLPLAPFLGRPHQQIRIRGRDEFLCAHVQVRLVVDAALAAVGRVGAHFGGEDAIYAPPVEDA